jgi:hypothetical protein
LWSKTQFIEQKSNFLGRDQHFSAWPNLLRHIYLQLPWTGIGAADWSLPANAPLNTWRLDLGVWMLPASKSSWTWPFGRCFFAVLILVKLGEVQERILCGIILGGALAGIISYKILTKNIRGEFSVKTPNFQLKVSGFLYKKWENLGKLGVFLVYWMYLNMNWKISRKNDEIGLVRWVLKVFFVKNWSFWKIFTFR